MVPDELKVVEQFSRTCSATTGRSRTKQTLRFSSTISRCFLLQLPIWIEVDEQCPRVCSTTGGSMSFSERFPILFCQECPDVCFNLISDSSHFFYVFAFWIFDSPIDNLIQQWSRAALTLTRLKEDDPLILTCLLPFEKNHLSRMFTKQIKKRL